MKLLEMYGSALGKYPVIFIILILMITGVMGYYSSQFSQSTSEDSFSPDDEVSRANLEVQDEFGNERARISVYMESRENILSLSNLLAQLELEDRITDSNITDIIVPTPDAPSGISSPAEVVVQSIFYTRAFELSLSYTNNTDEDSFSDCLTQEKITNSFIKKGFALTSEEKRIVLEGGEIDIDVDCAPFPLVLQFQQYDPSDLGSYTEAAPMAAALDFLLSSDLSRVDGSASKGLFVIYIQEGLEPDTALTYEEELDTIASDISSDNEDLKMITIGDEIVSKKINEASGATQGLLFTLAMVMVIVILAFVFRSLFEIVINVTGLFMAVIWVFGIGGIFGFEFNPALTTVPVLVIGLGVDYGIHLTSRYREELSKGKKAKDALRISEGTVGFAILLASVTTLIGFLSNITAGSPGIRVFGILNAAGIMAAFIIMMTFVPSARIIRDRWREKRGKELIKKRSGKGSSVWGWAVKRAEALGLDLPGDQASQGIGPVNRFLSLGSVLAQHPIPVLSVVLVLSIGGGIAGAQLEPTFDFRDFLPEGLEVTDAARSVVTDFDFSSEEAYVLAEGDVSEPAVLLAMAKVEAEALEKEDIVSSRPIISPYSLGLDLSDVSSPQYNSTFSVIWYTNLDNDLDGEVDENITVTNVQAVYDALFAVDSDQASRVLRKDNTGSYDGLVVRIPVNSKGGERSEEIREQIRDSASALEDLEGGELDKVTATGGPLVQQAVLESISSNQMQSVLITFLVSLAILTVIFMITRRSILLGLVTILPLVFVIAWTLGSMWLIGIPLNVVTVTISAITVGLGIDYSVHVSQRFMEDLDRIGDGICAISVAVNHTGSALFGSALTTVIGFAILSFAIIPPLAQFGQVTALSITFAFLGAVFVLPAMLILWLRLNYWYRRKFKGEDIPDMLKECTIPKEELNK